MRYIRAAVVAVALGGVHLVSSPMVEAQAYEVVPVKDGAVVEGNVAFKGEAPAPKQIIMGKDIDVCGLDPVTGTKSITRNSRELLVKNGRIANAIVYLEGITKGKAWKVPAGGFTLDQRNCDFSPRVSAFQPGEITVVNSDPVLHNSHGFEGLELAGARSVFNIAQPNQGQRTKIRLRRPAIHEVKCDAHGWMHAWIYVGTHPYVAITKEDGAFRLDEIPSGSYKLIAWHETLGKQEKEVTVKAGGRVNVVFEFSMKP